MAVDANDQTHEACGIAPARGERLRGEGDAQFVDRASRILLVLISAFVMLAVVGGWLVFENTAAGETLKGVQPTVEQSAERTVGRPIDLSSLDKERGKTMTKTGTLSTVVVLLLVAVVLGSSFLLFYNHLVAGREQVNAGWAQVENVYQRRLDLVPVLIDGVETYMDHERETLAELTEARARAIEIDRALAGQVPQTGEQLRAIETSQGAVQSALTRLLAVVENYPDLKASHNFRMLQDQIEGTENRLAMERRHYNEFARRYNTSIQTFPGNVVADTVGFSFKPYFEAETMALKGLDDPFSRNQKQ